MIVNTILPHVTMWPQKRYAIVSYTTNSLPLFISFLTFSFSFFFFITESVIYNELEISKVNRLSTKSRRLSSKTGKKGSRSWDFQWFTSEPFSKIEEWKKWSTKAKFSKKEKNENVSFSDLTTNSLDSKNDWMLLNKCYVQIFLFISFTQKKVDVMDFLNVYF